MEMDDLILVITSKIRPIYTKWLNIRRNPTDFSKSDICRKIRRTTDTEYTMRMKEGGGGGGGCVVGRKEGRKGEGG